MKCLSSTIVLLALLSACSDDGPGWIAAPGVTVEEVAVYQGIENILYGGEQRVDAVPVIPGRDALFRVFATGNDEYDREPVLAKLTLVTPDGDPVVYEEPIRSLPLTHDDSSLEATVNFWLPGEAITPDTHWASPEILDSQCLEGQAAIAASPPAS